MRKPSKLGTRSTLTHEVAARLGIPQEQARSVLEALLSTITGHLAQGHTVQMRGWGTFWPVRRKGHVGRNPRTGQAVPVPAHRTVRLRMFGTARPDSTDGG